MINQITAIQENIFPKLLHKNSGRNGIPLKENGDSCSRNLPPYDSKLYTKPFQMNLLHLEISHSEVEQVLEDKTLTVSLIRYLPIYISSSRLPNHSIWSVKGVKSFSCMCVVIWDNISIPGFNFLWRHCLKFQVWF